MRPNLIGALFITLFIFSCKKEPTTTEPDTSGNVIIQETQKKLRHQWDFKHSVLNDFVPIVATDTIHGQGGDYFVFASNNFCYSFYGNLYDTISYKVLNGTSMMYGGDTVEMVTLNANTFVFKSVSQTDTTHHENVIILFK